MDFNAYSNLITHQKDLPLISFLIAFASLALLESQSSAYEEHIPRLLRWPNHILLALLNALIFRLILPGFCVLTSMHAFGKDFGVLNQVRVPGLFGILFTIVFLDWVIYYLHRAFHALPWLWKIHRVHHTDPEVDVTTGLRFHTVEVLITTLVKALFIYLLGAPVYGVFLFEVIIGISFIYNHSNIAMPAMVEKSLRWVMITPLMHRVHHSVESKEMNSDFGFIFSCWDRFLGTYQEPSLSKKPKLGLNIFNGIKFLRLKALLLQPFLDLHGKFKLKNFTREN